MALKSGLKILIPASLAVFTMIIGCKHDPFLVPENPIVVIPDDSCDEDTVYFKNDILPLIVSNCATSGCHDQSSAQEGVVLVDYASIITSGEIKPGNPDGSELYEAITEDDPEKRMPPSPNAGLSVEQIQKIRTWIQQGALDNSCNSGCDTTNVTFSQQVWPTIQTNCTGCHSGANPGAGILLTDYQTVADAAASGRLYGSVAHLNGYSPMPKNTSKLDDCRITAIRIWIENNTPNN